VCCAGSARLYEDPDVDEYGSMEDVGYLRRSITNQQDFIMSQLDFLRVRFAMQGWPVLLLRRDLALPPGS
jgi:hypothetical protein